MSNTIKELEENIDFFKESMDRYKYIIDQCELNLQATVDLKESMGNMEKNWVRCNEHGIIFDPKRYTVCPRCDGTK